MTLAALCVLVVLAGACGRGSDRDSGRPPTVSTTSTGASTTTTTGTSTTGPGATTTTVAGGGPVCAAAGVIPPRAELRPTPIGGGLLTAVTVSSVSACVDDVSFAFRLPEAPGRPVVSAEYQSGPFRAAGSGEPVAVAGSAFLVVRFEPAYTADLSSERAPPTYTGPRRFTPGGVRFAREVVLLGDFEGVVTWVVGLDGTRPFEMSYVDTTLRVRLS